MSQTKTKGVNEIRTLRYAYPNKLLEQCEISITLKLPAQKNPFRLKKGHSN
jgi:hypothetical protein